MIYIYIYIKIQLRSFPFAQSSNVSKETKQLDNCKDINLAPGRYRKTVAHHQAFLSPGFHL